MSANRTGKPEAEPVPAATPDNMPDTGGRPVRASLTRGQLVVSPYPPVEYLEYLRENDSDFHKQIKDEYIQDRKHNRLLAKRGQNIFAYIVTIAFVVVALAIYKNSPWAAVTLFACGTFAVGTAFWFLASKANSFHMSLRHERREAGVATEPNQ